MNEKILKEYIRHVLKEEIDPKTDLINLFRRSFYDLGDEEIETYLKFGDWKNLYKSLLEMTHILYGKKSESYKKLVMSKDYSTICSLMTKIVLSKFPQAPACSTSVVEQFYMENL